MTERPATTTAAGDRLLLDVKAVALFLGLGERTIWRMAAAGKLPPPVRIGRRRLWHRPTIEAWAAQLAEQGASR